METIQARSEQIPLPINYYWNPTDPALPFSSAAPGNPFLVPPGNATRTPVPTEYPRGSFPCWDYVKQEWALRADFRQIRLWDKASGQEIFSSTVDCPPGCIDVEPLSRNSVWDDEKNEWVVDEEKARQDDISIRTRDKTNELETAASQIEQIKEIIDILDEGEEMDEYKALLKKWTQYRAKLNLFKPAVPTSVFPDRPKMLGE